MPPRKPLRLTDLGLGVLLVAHERPVVIQRHSDAPAAVEQLLQVAGCPLAEQQASGAFGSAQQRAASCPTTVSGGDVGQQDEVRGHFAGLHVARLDKSTVCRFLRECLDDRWPGSQPAGRTDFLIVVVTRCQGCPPRRWCPSWRTGCSVRCTSSGPGSCSSTTSSATAPLAHSPSHGGDHQNGVAACQSRTCRMLATAAHPQPWSPRRPADPPRPRITSPGSGLPEPLHWPHPVGRRSTSTVWLR